MNFAPRTKCFELYFAFHGHNLNHPAKYFGEQTNPLNHNDVLCTAIDLLRVWSVRCAGAISNFSIRNTRLVLILILLNFLVQFAGTNSGVHNESSCSSGPDSPHTSKELHLDGSGTPTRAQYLSASCVVFTHYSGDTASVVDEHFSRALNFSNKDSKGESPFFPN